MTATRTAPRTPHPVHRSALPPGRLTDPLRLDPARRALWRGGSRTPTRRRVVRLALFGLTTGLDPGLERVAEIVRDAGRARAQRRVDRAARASARRARRVDLLASRMARLDARAGRESDRVTVDPDGAAVDPARLVDDHDAAREEIARQREAGSRRHERTRWGFRALAAVLPWIDAVLFAYFVSGVSNANLAAPLTTPVDSFVALALTLLVVLVVAGFTPWLGRHLRHHKDADGELGWADLGPLTTGLVVLWGVLLAGLTATMWVRVHADAVAAGADALTGMVVSGLLALAALALNVFVLLVAFADGTAESDGLRARARVIRASDGRRARLLTSRAAAARRILRIVRRDRRLRERAMVAANRCLTRHEDMLELARLRCGHGPLPGPPGALDQLDLREWDAVGRQLVGIV